MKSLLRWGLTLGLVSSTLLGTGLWQSPEALALPQEQIIEKLKVVPVFTIADEQGAPLVASGQNNTKVAGVFISQKDAQTFVTQLQKEKPDIGNKVKVVPVSLAEIFQLDQTKDKDTNAVDFTYVPEKTEVDLAKQLIGDQYKGGVPLFVAKGGEKQGYLTIQKDKEELIPFFFEKSQLEEMLNRLKEQKPDLAKTVKIEVVPLEGVIETLKQSNDEALKRIVFIPSKSSVDFIRNAEQSTTTPK